MSEVPKPASLPTPRTANGARDYQSEEHEAALRAVWKKLDCGLERLFGWKGARLREESKASIAAFGSQLESVASMLEKLAGRCGEEPEMATWLLQTRERVVASRVVEQVGTCGKTVAAVEIVARELAKELTEERNARTSRAHDEVVGFIDLAAELLVPARLRLKGNIPACLIRDDEDQQQPYREPLRLMKQDAAVLHEVRTLAPTVPGWCCKKERKRVWIDVRVHAVPLGQMLREVKVLQALGDNKVKLILVMPTVDNEMEAMLSNERVIVTTHDWWKKL